MRMKLITIDEKQLKDYLVLVQKIYAEMIISGRQRLIPIHKKIILYQSCRGFFFIMIITRLVVNG